MPTQQIRFQRIIEEGAISDTLKQSLEKFLPKFLNGRKITDKNNAFEMGKLFGSKLSQVRPDVAGEMSSVNESLIRSVILEAEDEYARGQKLAGRGASTAAIATIATFIAGIIGSGTGPGAPIAAALIYPFAAGIVAGAMTAIHGKNVQRGGSYSNLANQSA